MTSLGSRLALVLSALVIFIIGSIGVYSWSRIGTISREQAEDRVLAEVETLSATAGPGFQGVYPLASLVNEWAAATGYRISLFDSEGRLIGDSVTSTELGQQTTAPEVREALAAPDASGRSQRLDQALGRRSLFVAAPVVAPDGRVAGVARIGAPIAQLEAAATPLRRLLLSTTLVGGILGIVLAILVARRIAAPFRTLAQAAESGSVLENPIFASGSEEAREVARGMNRLAEQARTTAEHANSERSRLLNILEHVPAAIVVIDDQEQITLTNPASERLFGFSAADASHRPFIEAIRDYEVAEAVREAAREQRTVRSELAVGARGQLVQVVAVPYREGGAQHVALVAHDLSEVRQAERLRHDFLANVSHELRTPLAGIQATLEALEMGGLEENATARTFIMNARHEVSRMGALVEGLLELSSLEMGWTHLDRTRTDLRAALERAIGTLAALAGQRGIAITLETPQDLPEALADAERLHQVVVNLLHNALKFTPGGGRVTVSARAEDGEVLVAVADTGPGIPPQDVPTLFDRMFQGDRSGPRGAGLGLSIVKQIVAAHGGRVWVESAPGQGATFTFSLPKA